MWFNIAQVIDWTGVHCQEVSFALLQHYTGPVTVIHDNYVNWSLN